MGLVKVSEILKQADKAKTAALAFDCTDYNMIYSAVTVAEELQKPVIVMLYPEHHYLNNAFDLAGFAATVKNLAAGVKVPVGLHLDHSSDPVYIMKAIKAGFTSVMVDGSLLPFEENMKLAERVTEIAHAFDVDVEAELGRVGLAKDSDQDKADMYTRPEIAAEFCERTHVDSIAVAIGNAHGVYLEKPKLDMERLDEINKATDVPLVLHGGSGIPDEQLSLAFRKGINKLNVGTEFFQTNYNSIREYCDTWMNRGNVFDMPVFIQERLMAYLRRKMELSEF